LIEEKEAESKKTQSNWWKFNFQEFSESNFRIDWSCSNKSFWWL